MQVNCTSPITIVNPLLVEFVAQHGNLFVNNREIKFYKPQKVLLYDFKPKKFLPFADDVTLDVFSSYYVRHCVTGEHLPAFIQVPCGHCEVCRNAKVNAFVDRCKLETQLYNSKPIFFTLTYDDLHKKESGVCLRDVQLFLKRLRITLHRQGYREKIRYAIVSEYGRRTSRPHYHGIFWNLHQSDILSYIQIRETISKCWSNGFVMLRLVDPSDDKAFYYTAKYLRKDCNVPSGCEKTFMVSSNRGGGIGAAFIDRIRKECVKQLNTEIKYVNKWNGRINIVQCNRYMLNRMCPSLSRSLPYSLVNRVRRFIKNYNVLYSRSDYNSYVFDDKLDVYIKFFSPFFFVPSRVDFFKNLDDKRSSDIILREMLQDEIFIDRFYSKGVKFFENAVFYSERRPLYLAKLFANVTEQDLSAKTYKIIRSNNLAAEREIL